MTTPETVNTTKPDFSSMSGPQLLDAYNSYAVSKRRAKFQNLSEGIRRCEQEYAAWLNRQQEELDAEPSQVSPMEPEEGPTTTDETETPNEEDTDMAKSATKKTAAKSATAKKTATKTKRADTRTAGTGRGRPRQGTTIKILTEGKKNPRREGSDAHAHFEAMKKHSKVSDYLDSFKDRKKASQWLWNTVRDGHVSVE